MNRRFATLRNDSGAAAFLSAILLVVILGITALVIDIARIIIAKQECQNAADAGALAGARHLIPYLNSSDSIPVPDWNSGETIARQAVTSNKSDNVLLTDCNIQSGYWNLVNKTLQSNTIVPTLLDLPAVRVTVNRTAGQNTGPVLMTFARIFGINVTDVSAQAMAVLPCPGSAPKNSLFPIAIAEALVQKYWNTDPPFTFRIGSDYHYPDDMAGQWTSFLTDINNVDYCRNLIENGNPNPISLNQDIWIQPGTETALYNDVRKKVNNMINNGLAPIVFVPVVRTDFNTHQYTPVKAFAPIYIKDVKGGDKKYIEAHFVKEALFPTNDAGGQCLGGFVPPALAN